MIGQGTKHHIPATQTTRSINNTVYALTEARQQHTDNLWREPEMADILQSNLLQTCSFLTAGTSYPYIRMSRVRKPLINVRCMQPLQHK